MRDTIYCVMEEANEAIYKRVTESIHEMAAHVQTFVPGYHLNRDPIFQNNIVSISIKVKGLGDFLPVYAGNLDIMTAAATKFAEEFAKYKLAVRK